MTTLEIALIIAVVVSVAAVAAYFSYRSYRLTLYELKQREMELHHSRERAREDIYILGRRFEEMVAVSRKTSESALEDIQGRFLAAMEIRLTQLDTVIKARTGPAAEQATKFSNRPGLLIREISHALNTPLSQMEAALLTAKAELRHSDPQSIAPRLRSIQIGLEICKSVVASFRELILGSKANTTWAPQSLREAISAAADAYISQNGAKLLLRNELPESLSGYSNNYLIGLLLPLIENAIDSAAPDTSVCVSISRLDGFDKLSVSNNPVELPISDEIYRDGFTTKTGHTGTGLTIVQHLLAVMPSATLSHKVVDGILTFDIMLEARS